MSMGIIIYDTLSIKLTIQIIVMFLSHYLGCIWIGRFSTRVS